MIWISTKKDLSLFLLLTNLTPTKFLNCQYLKVSHDHLQGNADAGKDNKLEQAVQIKSDSKDTSVNKETKSSDATRLIKKLMMCRLNPVQSNDNEVKKETETQKDDNQGASADEG